MSIRRALRNRIPGLARRTPLPSLYERHPAARAAVRLPRGLQIVPLGQIVGTVRHPSQNTDDFLPLPYLRGRNWAQRWQRIQQGTRDLAIMPAVELVRVRDEYYVADGHNRVAAALRAGAVAIDADVTDLQIAGEQSTPGQLATHRDAASILTGADEVRQAGAGRQSRTAEHRTNVDELRREMLTQDSEGREPPERDG